ncbi:MAG: nickel-responsive transcriptional regulator NikR [Verrucomicrobiota bacterium]
MESSKRTTGRPKRVGGIQRISVSLPEQVFVALDDVIRVQGFENRSQAIAELVTARHGKLDQEIGNTIMAGTITLIYDQTKGNVQRELCELQQEHIDEVISTLRVLLQHDHIMEVIVVQGPGRTLRRLADKFLTRKGVCTGELTIASQIMPPIHPLRES